MSAVRVRPGIPWFWFVVVLAGAALGLVTWWVAEGGINRGEALKTGGLAAGSVVALYALWLNDRRRRVDEQRIEHDRERVADERFARAVELLGHEADQVRVGALHALAGLATREERYKQIVLDVLCAYLRRPFGIPEADDEAGIREQQVRVTAQRLIAELLTPVGSGGGAYDLDLHGATLEYFDLSYRVVGQLRMRATNLHKSTRLKGMRVVRQAWFTGATCHGRFYAEDVVFADRCWFSRFEAHGAVDFEGTEFRDDTKFAGSVFRGVVSFADTAFAGTSDFGNVKVSLGHTYRLPDGYAVDPIGTEFGLVRASAGTYVEER